MASVLKVDKLDPQSGTALEIGSSGDTITIPSGATFTQSGTMNASAITAGTIATARLGSGTASSSTVLYGDQTYKAEPGGGKVLQVQSDIAQSRTTGSGTTYADAGADLTDTITCAATSSKVLVIASFNYGVDNANAAVAQVGIKQRCLRSDDAFVSDSNQIYATMAYAGFPENSGMDFQIFGTTCMVIVDSPSSVAELTYKVQVHGYNSTDLWEVGTDIGSEYGSRGITLIEIGA